MQPTTRWTFCFLIKSQSRIQTRSHRALKRCALAVLRAHYSTRNQNTPSSILPTGKNRVGIRSRLGLPRGIQLIESTPICRDSAGFRFSAVTLTWLGTHVLLMRDHYSVEPGMIFWFCFFCDAHPPLLSIITRRTIILQLSAPLRHALVVLLSTCLTIQAVHWGTACQHLSSALLYMQYLVKFFNTVPCRLLFWEARASFTRNPTLRSDAW